MSESEEAGTPVDADDYRDAAASARLKHATLRYNTLRLAFLLVAIALLWLVRVKGVLLIALALLISGLASYVFLRKQRTLMLAQIAGGIERRRQKSAVHAAREDAFQDDDAPHGGAA